MPRGSVTIDVRHPVQKKLSEDVSLICYGCIEWSSIWRAPRSDYWPLCVRVPRRRGSPPSKNCATQEPRVAASGGKHVQHRLGERGQTPDWTQYMSHDVDVSKILPTILAGLFKWPRHVFSHYSLLFYPSSTMKTVQVSH